MECADIVAQVATSKSKVLVILIHGSLISYYGDTHRLFFVMCGNITHVTVMTKAIIIYNGTVHHDKDTKKRDAHTHSAFLCPCRGGVYPYK